MTRKEWIEKNLPAYIDDCSDGGVISCPRSYNELVRIDPSVLTNEPCEGCREVTPFVCEKCWNMELNIKEERKETTALCDRCNCAPICSIKCDYHQTLADLTSLKKRNPAFTITCDCEYFTPASCEKGE